MLRYFWLILWLAASIQAAAFLPGNIGEWRKTSTGAPETEFTELWREYGLDASEQGEYTGPGGTAQVTAWRLQDPTGAFAAFQWRRPSAAGPSSLAEWAVEAPDEVLILHGNYVLSFRGWKPEKAVLEAFVKALPKVRNTSLPALLNYVPSERRIRNSERYILGPESLKHFEPRIGASIAAFQMGSEGQTAQFRTPGGDTTLVVFSYPTPQMAKERIDDFQQVPGAVVKRTGPLLAVALGGPPAEAEALVARVNYQPTVTWNEATPKPPGNPGEMILAIMILAGVLIALSVLLGFLFGGMRVLLGRFGIVVADDSLTALNLSKR